MGHVKMQGPRIQISVDFFIKGFVTQNTMSTQIDIKLTPFEDNDSIKRCRGAVVIEK